VKKIAIFILIYLCFDLCFARNIYQTQIDNGEENFKKGNFIKTIEIYENLIQVEKVNDPSVYYNLSNAYYRSGNLGKAIINIEKASKLVKNDKQTKNNSQCLHAIINEHTCQKISNFFVRCFFINKITIVLSVVLILFFVFLFLFIIKKLLIFKKIIFLLICFFIVCIFIFNFKCYGEIVIKKCLFFSTTNVRDDSSWL
jgi:tetratricopeptide (TPR) repeat protein